MNKILSTQQALWVVPRWMFDLEEGKEATIRTTSLVKEWDLCRLRSQVWWESCG